MAASIEESSSNPWSRVCDLVDLKAPVLAASASSRSGSRSGRRRGSAAELGLEGEEAFRATEKMRSLIIQVARDQWLAAGFFFLSVVGETAGGKGRCGANGYVEQNDQYPLGLHVMVTFCLRAAGNASRFSVGVDACFAGVSTLMFWDVVLWRA